MQYTNPFAAEYETRPDLLSYSAESHILPHPNLNRSLDPSWPQHFYSQHSPALAYPALAYPTHSPFPPPRLSPPPFLPPFSFKSPGLVATNGFTAASTSNRLTLAGSLDPATGIFYRTPEHPRLRTAQACEKCRTRKAKCSGEHPSCKRCSTRGLICEYAKEGRVRGPNKPKGIKGNPLMSPNGDPAPTTGSLTDLNSPVDPGKLPSSARNPRRQSAQTQSPCGSAGSPEDRGDLPMALATSSHILREDHTMQDTSLMDTGPLLLPARRYGLPGSGPARRSSHSHSITDRPSRPRRPDLHLETSQLYRLPNHGLSLSASAVSPSPDIFSGYHQPNEHIQQYDPHQINSAPYAGSLQHRMMHDPTEHMQHSSQRRKLLARLPGSSLPHPHARHPISLSPSDSHGLVPLNLPASSHMQDIVGLDQVSAAESSQFIFPSPEFEQQQIFDQRQYVQDLALQRHQAIAQDDTQSSRTQTGFDGTMHEPSYTTGSGSPSSLLVSYCYISPPPGSGSAHTHAGIVSELDSDTPAMTRSSSCFSSPMTSAGRSVESRASPDVPGFGYGNSNAGPTIVPGGGYCEVVQDAPESVKAITMRASQIGDENYFVSNSHMHMADGYRAKDGGLAQLPSGESAERDEYHPDVKVKVKDEDYDAASTSSTLVHAAYGAHGHEAQYPYPLSLSEI